MNRRALVLAGLLPVATGIFLLADHSPQETCCLVPDAGADESEYIETQSACHLTVPFTTVVDRNIATLPNGKKILITPCLDAGPSPWSLHHPQREPGDIPAGQLDYAIGLVNPYDAQPNVFNDAAVDSAVAGIELWAPFYDAGFYAHFVQFVGSFVVPGFPPDLSTPNEIWPGLQTCSSVGCNDNGGITGGGNVLQPILGGETGPNWSVSFVWCCDASSIDFTPSPPITATPGQVVTFEIMVDSRFPCPPNGLGCHYLMGANVGAVENTSFGQNYFSVLVPPEEGPVYTANIALELATGSTNACPAALAGGDAGYQFHVNTLYEANDPAVSAVPTLPITAPYPPPIQANFPTTRSGQGYWITGGIQSGAQGIAPGFGFDQVSDMGFNCSPSRWNCKCDAGPDGNSWYLTWAAP
jgi:hypothetical protein